MTRFIILSVCFLSFGIFSCNQNEKAADTNNKLEGDAIEKTVNQSTKVDKKNYTDFNLFWVDFQKHIAEDAIEKLKKMSKFGVGNLRQQFYEEDYPSVVSKELKGKLAKTKAADVLVEEDSPVGKARVFAHEESSTFEGEEYESGIYFYFLKIEGSWKFVAMSAAG